MPEAALIQAPAETPLPAHAPQLLVELDPWGQAFARNLRETLFPPQLPPLHLKSAPAAFWPDVFVKRGLPWRKLLQSYGLHIVVGIALISLSRLIPHALVEPPPRAAFDHTQVIVYTRPEELPPLDTRPEKSALASKADPELSRQPIISVPPEADNRSQTIVTPPNVKLKHDVPLPNIVAWSDKPQLPIAPPPMVPAAQITRLTPQMEHSVVAPPPDAIRQQRRNLQNLQTSVVAPPPDLQASAKTPFRAPEASVIAPPQDVNANSRQLGSLNIGRSDVIAPAPQLPVAAQRSAPGAERGKSSGLAPQVVAPPPSLSGSGSSSGGGRVIALNLHPAVGAPAEPPAGNRRGSFAASPNGRAGASGNPGTASGDASGASSGSGTGKENGSGSKNGKGDLPSGLYVGNASNPAKTGAVGGNGTMPAANARPSAPANIPAPRVSARPLQPGSTANLAPAEREVFGDRKFYSLTLNMPNLNSAGGGSWVIRFAELKHDEKTGDLSSPAVTRKVDPAYPLQMMRENVSGTEILYAVIHADGTVGNVRVLRSVDERIDQFASQALAKWQFQPATKNGEAVDVEATFQIPFRPSRSKSDF